MAPVFGFSDKKCPILESIYFRVNKPWNEFRFPKIESSFSLKIKLQKLENMFRSNKPRKDHFPFFRQFKELLFNATVEIDWTKAYSPSKSLKASFFLSGIYIKH
jgi:hypothetical protein